MWKSLEHELTALCDYNLHLNQLLLEVEKRWQHFVEKFCSWEICKCHCANAGGEEGSQGVRNPPEMTTDKCITRLITTLASYNNNIISVYLVWAKSGV